MSSVPASVAAPVGEGWGLPVDPFCGMKGFPKCLPPIPSPIPGGFSIFRDADSNEPDGAASPQPALIGVHCSFAQNIIMLAKSVSDCESAGGQVDAAYKAAVKSGKSS